MRRRACLLAIALLLAAFLILAAVNAGAFLVAMCRSLLYLHREAKIEARVAATVTAEAQREEQPAPELTPEEVLAALDKGHLEIERIREDPDDLPSSLDGAQRCYEFHTSVGGMTYRVRVLSYSDAQEARRVARREREIYQSTQGNSCYALSRGGVVVTVWPVDEDLVDRVRAVLETMPRE
jgi:hypothetical protein